MSDLALIQWFHTHCHGAYHASLALSALGGTDFYLLVLTAVYWAVDARLGRRLVLALLLNTYVNAGVKSLGRRPRPYWLDPHLAHSRSTDITYGFPSGHAQLSLGVWGLAIARGRWRWRWVVLSAYALAMGLARMIVGAHFLGDVVGGWLLGTLLLLGWLRWGEAGLAWLRSLSARAQSTVVVATVALGFALALLGVDPVGGGGLVGAMQPLGALLGLGLGFVWERARLGVTERGTRWQRLGRLAVGWAGLLVLKLGAKPLAAACCGLPAHGVWPPVPAAALAFVTLAALGFWSAAVAPALFVRLGLATR